MKTTVKGEINYAAIAALIFSVFCWVALYAVYADFAQSGVELLERPGILRSGEAVLLIGLHTFGLLLLWAFLLGAVAAVARLVLLTTSRADRISGTPH